MKDNLMVRYRIIETEDLLRETAEALAIAPKIAVDLEADSMYHFKERVCLLQIATEKGCYVIDPIRLPDLSLLRPIFSDRRIQKIFHGSDYDVRSLYRDFRIEVSNLFDTQVASRFLGMPETGLEAVLQKRLGISLNKKFQKKDWSQRPLSEEMVEYAAMDSIYLIALAELLEKELEVKGRYSWVMEESERLSRVRPGASDDLPLYLKFKGAGRLDPRSLAVLESLLRYRLRLAEAKDRPPFKILGSGPLLKIAQEKPTTLHALQSLGALTPKQIGMYGAGLIQAVAGAMDVAAPLLPYPCGKRSAFSPAIPERVKALKRWRDERAETLDIDPSLICSKSLMCAIALKNPRRVKDLEEMPELRNWQRRTFGEEYVDAVRKGMSLRR